MTTVTARQREAQHDVDTPDPVQLRFGIDFRAADVAESTIVMAMPMSGLHNPFTGAPAFGPLAILVDFAAGMVNHYRRSDDQWTVSTELSIDAGPGYFEAIADTDAPVVASAKAVGPVDVTSLALCTLSCDEVVIGTGTVRSVFVRAVGVVNDRPARNLKPRLGSTLADLMSVEIETVESTDTVLHQLADQDLNNDIGIVHGGTAAAGLEVVASAAMNRDTQLDLLQTASLRVNFLRPFTSGAATRYVGTTTRVGRSSGLGDAHAIGDDGKVAITARVTAYR